MTNIKERVLQITDLKGISKEKFFNDLGVSYANFKGKAKEKALSSDVLANIIAKYPEISSYWLLTGEGEALLSKKKHITQEKSILEVRINNQDREIDRLNNIIDIIITKLELEKEMRLLAPKEKG
ncbi:hypothetical protein CXF68_20300 [Tenacibaculum sp. Bg11-29]|uniref:hypothetical protein n=1 Tax=Tenacibaculum sp. Bg11-29 TaxID=2058306 RepID=UPI000C333266|nr:hypothetical protein [Tenacibaculum sp. Bg11-29]PKH52896.1 hypothetical protein CXF68_20300 [Tenacibaculum sp. Bg11-29]